MLAHQAPYHGTTLQQTGSLIHLDYHPDTDWSGLGDHNPFVLCAIVRLMMTNCSAVELVISDRERHTAGHRERSTHRAVCRYRYRSNCSLQTENARHDRLRTGKLRS